MVTIAIKKERGNVYDSNGCRIFIGVVKRQLDRTLRKVLVARYMKLFYVLINI